MNDIQTNPARAELAIEKWIYGGMGLGRIDGRVVLAPFVLPGERAEVRIAASRRDMATAEVVRILEPSPVRVPAACPYFARCGGCQYQHAPYDFQSSAKREILREVLRRVGKIDAPEEIPVLTGPAWEYRNRTQLHFRDRRAGYMQAGSHKLCGIDQCPISSPKINQAIGALSTMVRDRRFPSFLRSMEIFTNETDLQIQVVEAERGVAGWFYDWCAEEMAGASRGPLDYPAAGHTFRVSPRAFFQVNRFLIERLIETALADAGGETALDLYAGVGLFSLPLASRFRSVIAVESGASAVEDLRHNAARAGLSVEVRHGSCESVLDTLEATPDFVLADPPRAGLGKYVVRHLLARKPARLAIVACDPATLARDLAPLLAGGFRLARMTLVDLFPQTYHLETVAILEY